MDVLQPYMDQARDWIAVNYPELEGEAYDQKLKEVAQELYEADEEPFDSYANDLKP